LHLKCDIRVSKFAFKFNLYRYVKAAETATTTAERATSAAVNVLGEARVEAAACKAKVDVMREAYVTFAAEQKQHLELERSEQKNQQQQKQGLLKTQRQVDEEAAAAKAAEAASPELRAATADAEAASLRARLLAATAAVEAALTRARAAEVKAGDLAASSERAEVRLHKFSIQLTP
jgi:hypothetical protein